MALIKCPECGRKVSTESARCRNCGYPIPKNEEEQILTTTVNRSTTAEKETMEHPNNIKTIRCSNCGIKIAEGARFCPECGHNLCGNNLPLNSNLNNGYAPNNVRTVHTIVRKRKSKAKLWVIAITSVLFVLIIALLLFPKNGIENDVKKILEDDMVSSVKISTLYYNEEKQGCLVEFETETSIDIAAIHLDTGKIDYKSEFNFYSDKAERLRKQRPIDEQELHKCNQKILESSYADWSFTIAVMKANGETEKNGWVKVK